MKKILLTIQYNGSTFCGWQRQNNQRTIQETLESKISALLGHPVVLHASGRTDAGVHAFAQTAHFETTSNFDIAKLPQTINHGLDKSISVLSAKKVSNAFHARFSVKKKTYLYRTYASSTLLPLFDGSHARIPQKVLQNLQAVKTAANILVGTHNFKAFCSAHTSAQNFERTIFEIKIKKTKFGVDFFVTGNGFLYNMVRIIVGTLVAVGEGKILPEQILQLLQNPTRNHKGKTMPAHALYLFKVQY